MLLRMATDGSRMVRDVSTDYPRLCWRMWGDAVEDGPRMVVDSPTEHPMILGPCGVNTIEDNSMVVREIFMDYSRVFLRMWCEYFQGSRMVSDGFENKSMDVLQLVV